MFKQILDKLIFPHEKKQIPKTVFEFNKIRNNLIYYNFSFDDEKVKNNTPLNFYGLIFMAHTSDPFSNNISDNIDIDDEINDLLNDI